MFFLRLLFDWSRRAAGPVTVSAASVVAGVAGRVVWANVLSKKSGA